MIDTRMKELNKYIINMLLSEGVYKNENEVLYGNEHGNQPNITTSNLASMVNELVNDKFLIQSDEIKSCQKDVMELTNKLKTCETTTKKLTDEIIETNKNLDCLKLTVESLPTNDTLLTFGKNLSSAMLIGVSEIINKK
jgi:septal ring factor EnvC (AmiA/AmiB activator)